jgi:Kef-type K+ transport system membrane component KefB/Trk K+ transport system NAD-binding subunit
MEHGPNLFPLLLVLVLAFAVPLLVGRVRWLPVVVGEIIAGVIIGRSVLNLVHEASVLEIMSNMGLAFLMFLAGMEIDFDKLIPSPGARVDGNQRKLLVLTPLIYLVTLGLAVPSGFLLLSLGLESDPWLLAFILSATSLGIVLPILKQREMTHTPTGQAIFYTALLADFLTVILLTIYLITREQGFNLQVFSVGLLFLAFFLVYRIGSRFFRIRTVRSLISELSNVTVQIKVRGAIAILMAFVVLAGFLGVELILGAFLAGMIISLLRNREDIALVEKLEAFGFGFFIPVFFIMVGVNLDLRTLVENPESLLLLPVLLVLSVVVKLVPGLLLKGIISWRETFAGGMLLNTHLSIEIAIAVIGERLGLISPAAAAVVIVFSTLTILFMPVFFNFLIPKTVENVNSFFVIFGAEDFGIQVARVMAQHGEQVLFLEPDQRLVRQAEQAGFEAIEATAIQNCLHYAMERGAIRTLLILSQDDVRNLLVSHAARQLDIQQVIALVNDPARLPEYRAVGVRPFTSAMYNVPLLAAMARNTDLFTLLTDMTDKQDVREVYLRNPLLKGERLRTIHLPGNLTVLSVGRNGDLIVPHGNTRLEIGDHLTLFGDVEDMKAAVDWLERVHIN